MYSVLKWRESVIITVQQGTKTTITLVKGNQLTSVLNYVYSIIMCIINTISIFFLISRLFSIAVYHNTPNMTPSFHGVFQLIIIIIVESANNLLFCTILSINCQSIVKKNKNPSQYHPLSILLDLIHHCLLQQSTGRGFSPTLERKSSNVHS